MKHGNLKMKVLWLMVIFILAGLILNQTQCHGEWQVWNADSIEAHWKGPWYMKLEEEFRMGNDVRRFIYQSSDVGVIYKKDEFVKLSAHCRYAFLRAEDSWEKEIRPHVNAILSWHALGLDLSDRNRLEYRIRSQTKDRIRYRNKLKARLPVKWTSFEVTPYISEEVFVDFDQDDFNENRLSPGIEFNMFKNTKGELYYLWQASEYRGSWTSADVIGTKIKIKF